MPIPGTTEVGGPVAPPSTSSNFGGASSMYFEGGFQEWFTSEGDWTNPAILPAGRKRVGMWVRSISMGSSKKWYQLDSMGPDVWTAIDITTIPTAANGVTVVNTVADLTTIAGTATAGNVPGAIYVRGYNTVGIGEGLWVYNSTSVAAPSAAVIAVTAGGRLIQTFPAGYVTPQQCGATVDGTTNNTASFTATTAIAAAAGLNHIHLPEGTYILDVGTSAWSLPNDFKLTLGSGAVVKPRTYPATTYNGENIQNPMIIVGSNCIIEGCNENHFNGRRYDSSYTTGMDITKQLSLLWMLNVENITIKNVGFTDCFYSPIWYRTCSDIQITNCQFYDSCQAIFGFSGESCLIKDNVFDNMKLTVSGVDIQIFNFLGGTNTQFIGNTITNTLCNTGTSSALVMLNMWGEIGFIAEDNYFGQMDPASTKASAPLYLDGGVGCQIINNQVYANHLSASIAIACEGATDFLVQGNFIVGPHQGAAGTGAAIHMRNGGWTSASKPGGTQWRDPAILQPSTTTAFNGVIRDNEILCGYNSYVTGVLVDGSDILVEGNHICGANFAGVRIESSPDDSGGLFVGDYTSDLKNITIRGNTIECGLYYGLVITSGTNIDVVNNKIRNNGQLSSSGAGAILIRSQLLTSTPASPASTTTVIQCTGGLVVDAWRGYHLYVPSTGAWGVVASNTATTVTLTAAITGATPGASVAFTLSPGRVGKVAIRNNDIYDDQDPAVTFVGAGSTDPTQTYDSAQEFFIQSSQGQMLKPGKRVVLKGFLAGDVDATVQCVRKDLYYADRFWVRPVSPTTGTIATAVGLAVVAGTGTISYTDNASIPLQWQNRTALTGVGTQFITQVKDNTYIKAASASAWGLIKTITSDTAGTFLTNQPANFTAQTFVRSLFGIAEIKSQNRAYDVQNSPIVLDMRDNAIWGNEGSAGVTSPQGTMDLATALDGIPRIVGNSTTPTVDVFARRMRFAYTGGPTVITDIKNGAEGVVLEILCDGNVTFGFASGGTKLKGNNGAGNKTPDAGDLAICRYIQGFWLCEFVEV